MDSNQKPINLTFLKYLNPRKEFWFIYCFDHYQLFVCRNQNFKKPNYNCRLEIRCFVDDDVTFIDFEHSMKLIDTIWNRKQFYSVRLFPQKGGVNKSKSFFTLVKIFQVVTTENYDLRPWGWKSDLTT